MAAPYNFDILIIGSGAAGLSLALRLGDQQQIAVLAKGDFRDSATFYAQGGIAAVLDPNDSIESHIKDTLIAGGGLCKESTVRFTVEKGPESIEWLLNQGTPFTKDNESGNYQYHLTREGGHSHRRIIHSADTTGQAVEETLLDQVKRKDNIKLFEQHIAIDLVTLQKLGLPGNRCVGAYVYNRDCDKVLTFRARFIVLATGGASKAYLYTSNPDISTGDGIAMAWRAGCRVANMEFIQFHPTCLYHPQAGSFLLTEALRGEGAKLRRPDGSQLMKDFDPRGELAPRDVVARAIDYEMKRLGEPCMYLDISHKPASFVMEHFPAIHEKCLAFGFDMTKEPLPIVPAAHYTCGGVITDLNGCTDIAGLYAIGEVSCTGLHGANRMASNSLLECIVFAAAAGQHIEANSHLQTPSPNIPDWDASKVADSDERVVVSHNWEELRRFMWDYVGIVRTNKRLQRAQHRVDLLQREIAEYYWNFRINHDLIELRNLCLVADLIIRCAMQRKESRGLHYNLDFPNLLETAEDSLLIPENFIGQTL